MNIDSIRNGMVIDHISAGYGMKLYHLLGLEELDVSVAIIKNVPSKKMGRKDIIKIDAEIPVNPDVIGFVDPGATVNVIRDGKLVEKKITWCQGCEDTQHHREDRQTRLHQECH